MTPLQFYNETLGKSYEMDGAPANDPIQCADYFKKACATVCGTHWATGGDGYVDWWWYNRNNQHPEFFDFITDWKQFKNGDFVVWPHKKRNASSPFPSSHIGMYWEKSTGTKYLVGQNQPYKYITEKAEPDSVWAAALGALRFKGWTESDIKLPYGKTVHTWNNINITAVRGPKTSGYDLHMITANGEKAVQKIGDFDSDKLTILAGVNANYFQMSDGRHLGCEGDGTVQGYQQIVPLQKGWLAFFQKDGTTACWDSTAYYYDQKDVDFVCTPYAVRLFHGQTTYYRSTNCGDKDDIKNTQTAALKFKNGDWAVAIFSDCYPRNVYEWAIRFEGIQDVILMDSGGSTQMFECTSGTRKIVKETGRLVSSALVIAKKNDGSAAPDIIPSPQPEADEQPENAPEIDLESIKAENEKLKNVIAQIKELISSVETKL